MTDHPVTFMAVLMFLAALVGVATTFLIGVVL